MPPKKYSSIPTNSSSFSYYGRQLKQTAVLPIPISICDPVVLVESICYRSRANRLRNESNTTERLRKIWTGVYAVKVVLIQKRIPEMDLSLVFQNV